MPDDEEDLHFPLEGGPLDGDDCSASSLVCLLPVDAFPMIADVEEDVEVDVPDHPDGLMHLYARCGVHHAFHYLGVWRNTNGILKKEAS